MRALITGGYGFAGRHLATHLVSCGDDVAVTYYPADKDSEMIARVTEQLPASVQSMGLDVTDREAVQNLITVLQPDVVYHLAALTFVPGAEAAPREVFAVNLDGTLAFLDALREQSPNTRLLYVSSSEVYGEPRPGTLPITELAEIRPISTYGVTKAAADAAVYKYSYRDNIHAIRVRPFPHIGPGQSDSFAFSSFARQIAAIKLGRTEPIIRVGNLEVKRDISDVSDIVRGYREAILNGKRGEAYNLCSGVNIEVGEVLQQLIKIAEVDVEIVVDPDRERPVDIMDVYGSYDKAQKDFGWKPRIDLNGTLHSLLAFWLEYLSAG